ncbi:MAG TPA: alpha/beta hydrolase [Streptosporangiaceae bacterium]|nr:alpha/beta hydrolase [Streptosporangiaceae bacterium]
MVTVAILAWCTLLALAPPRTTMTLGLVSFLFGFVLNELPFVAFYYLLVSTIVALGPRGIDSSAAWATVGLTALTTAGLVTVAWRGLRTRAAIDHALTEGLGAGWSTTIDAQMSRQLRRTLPLARIVFAPFVYRRRDVERIANVSYGNAGRKNMLDIYRHRSHPAGSPVLVHLHGGGLFMGRKNREALPLLYQFASHGWLCISANYRLRPAATFPDHLIDVKKVICWVREHGHLYGGSAAPVFVAGSSSGGQLAALAALTPNEPAYQPGFESADTSVSAVICLHSYYGAGTGDGSPSAPLAYHGTDAPPFFVVHGDRDSLIPVKMARLFAERLQTASPNPVVYAELPGGQHGFDRFHSLRFDSVVNGIEAFAAWVRSCEMTQTTRSRPN